jgi:transposase
MYKIPRQRYTAEFKQEAVRQVQSGRSPAQVARDLSISEQTLSNWRKAAKAGKPVSMQEMELSRLKAENVRLQMELEIVKKAAAYFARESL